MRLDTFREWIEQRGFCGCTSNGASGTTQTGAAGCIPGVLQREGTEPQGQQQEAQGAGCYVVAPDRCSYSQPSAVFPGAAWVACDPATNHTFSTLATGLLAAEQLHEQGEEDMIYPINASCPVL